MPVTLYHNPRCSKSRQALELLRKHGVEPEIILYLENPPGKARLKELLRLLGMDPRDLMRKGEEVYKSLKLADPGLPHSRLIDAMVENPILIERPIATTGKRAVIGRPPEKVLEVLRA
jgi:arsenate reductase